MTSLHGLGVGILVSLLWVTGCGCGGPNVAHAKSAPASIGTVYGDPCLRSPQNEPDFDATFWRSDPPWRWVGSDGISYGNCDLAPAYPGRIPTPAVPTPTPYSYVPVPTSRGTFTLVNHDELVYRGPSGSVVTFKRDSTTALIPCR